MAKKTFFFNFNHNNWTEKSERINLTTQYTIDNFTKEDYENTELIPWRVFGTLLRGKEY